MEHTDTDTVVVGVTHKKMGEVAGSSGIHAGTMEHTQSEGTWEMPICDLRPSHATNANKEHWVMGIDGYSYNN